MVLPVWPLAFIALRLGLPVLRGRPAAARQWD
jgi:hypothetical protein